MVHKSANPFFFFFTGGTLQRSSILQPIYWTMSERPSNALRFRSIVEVEGVTYTSQNTFLQKKKKMLNNTLPKLKWNAISKRLWGLLYYDCKLVIYFIFLQMIGNYLFLGWKKSRLWGWKMLVCVKDCLHLWSWSIHFYYNRDLVTSTL